MEAYEMTIQKTMFFTLLPLFLALTVTNASAQEIIAQEPAFALGTTFTFEYEEVDYRNKKDSWGGHLAYKATDPGDKFKHDFGDYVANSNLVVWKKKYKKKTDSVIRIQFPLFHGKTWEYENSYKGGSGCGRMTESMTALVADTMVPVTVQDQEFEGVWIRHTGNWTSDNKCGKGYTGGQESGYLYVPELGFYVELYEKQILAKSSKFNYFFTGKMSAFTLAQ
jgi:hypothetical protein